MPLLCTGSSDSYVQEWLTSVVQLRCTPGAHRPVSHDLPSLPKSLEHGSSNSSTITVRILNTCIEPLAALSILEACLEEAAVVAPPVKLKVQQKPVVLFPYRHPWQTSIVHVHNVG